MKKRDSRGRFKSAVRRKTRAKKLPVVRIDEFGPSSRIADVRGEPVPPPTIFPGDFIDALIVIAILAVGLAAAHGSLSKKIERDTDHAEVDAMIYRPDFLKIVPPGFNIPDRWVP